MCCRYTTTPEGRPGVCVSILSVPCSCSSLSVVVLRVELSTTRLSAVSGQPALDYHCQRRCRSSRDGGTRTRALVLPGHAGCRCPTSRQPVRTGGVEPPISWPPARRDTQASLRSAFSGPYGNRTHLPGLKGRCPQTDRRTSHLGAHLPRREIHGWRALFTQWTGRCSNPRLRLFRPPLNRLSYQSNKKSPMSL